MDYLLVLVIIIGAAYWVLRHGRAQPPPVSISVEYSQDTTSTMTDDRALYAEDRIKELLRQLEQPYGYWTFANVPMQLEIELDRLLTAAPGNRVGQALKARMPALKRECATKMVLMRVQDLSERAELAVTVATKQKYAKEALVTIEAAIGEQVADPAPLREKVPVLRRYVARVEIEGFTDKAQRFEFKGNLKKALEYYQDALYSAIHDDVDDSEQRDTINDLTAKVEELSATIARVAGEKKAASKQR